ncbi:uncharacterized protein ZBIST_4128 [Zygosaccharomyces bailii]|nr:uncharacterized protein ZBIST_4128 [Zygosaccharomyces bailii]
MTIGEVRSLLFQGQVVKKQLECVGVAYTFCTSYSNKAAEDLAALMCSKSSGCFETATFVCSGSEANENAMRYIKQYHLEKGYPFAFMDRELGLSTGGPDIMTFGKTIGSGYVSLSGVLFSPKVVKTIEEGSGMAIGFQTYQSHHLNCRVGLALQQKLHENNLIDNVKVVGAYLKDQLKKQLQGCKVCGDVRGAGNFLSVELVKDRTTKEFFPPEMRMSRDLYQKTLGKGAHFMCNSGCAGYEVKDGKVIEYGDRLTMAPAFGFSKEDADFIVKVVKETFAEIEEQYL